MSSLPRTIPLPSVVSAEHQRVLTTLLNVNKERGWNAVLRVAGGWVRDMLLHVHSNDIDIAIETPAGAPEQISGRLFADAVSEYEARHGGGRARTVSTIRVNPAMSKHIETATVCVHNIPVEFCALRTDDYCENSRIPQVRPATPLEDALRRDFTINALFYNLSTGNVEDFTSGFADLQDRVLRCPLEPRKTFQDDPLRLLRGVRFVGQLGDLNFSLHEAIPACVDATLLEMLLQKVSRERIGKEVTKMFTGSRPEKCVELLHSMHLLQRVLLVEVYMKALPGAKKKLSAEVDHIVYLQDTAPSSAMDTLYQLNRVVIPCFSPAVGSGMGGNSGPSFRIGLAEEEKLAAVLFTLTIPFLRHAEDHAALEERLYAILINGLKMPVAIHSAVRRMTDCYGTLRRSALSIAELAPSSGELSGDTKLKIVDALANLNDKSVFPDAFKVVLMAYLLVECSPGLLQQASEHNSTLPVEELIAPLWAVVEQTPCLLNVFKWEPLVSGIEARTLPGVQAKQVGEILLYTRRQTVLDPSITREALLQSIKDKFAKPS